MNYSPPGSSVHGNIWQEFPSPGDLPDPGIEPRDRTQVSHTAGRSFISEPPGKLFIGSFIYLPHIFLLSLVF